MSTSARSRWPDIRFASSLWSRSSKDDSAKPLAAAGRPKSNLVQQQQVVESAARNQNNRSDAPDPNDHTEPAKMAELEGPRTADMGALDAFDNASESGGMDQDFGSLELFDSNHADAPFSSQTNSVAVDSSNQAPTAVMSAETPQPKKSKRDKKKKHHKEAAPGEPQPETDGSNSVEPGDYNTRSASPGAKRKLSSPHAPEGKRQKKNRTGSRKSSQEEPAEATIEEDAGNGPEQEANSNDQDGVDEESSNTSGEKNDAGQTARDNEVYDIENMDVENLAKEAWNEHVNGNVRRSRNAAANEKPADPEDVEMEDTAENDDANGTSNDKDPEDPDSAPQDDAEPTPNVRKSARGKKAKPTYFEQPVQDTNNDPDQAYDDLPSPSAMTPKPRRRAKAATKKSQPRKRAPPSGEDVEMDDEEDEDAPRGRRNRMAGFTQGRFTDDELARLSRAVEAFREENDLPQAEVNEMIHASGGTTAGEAHAQLWTRLFAECPDRHRQKVINITRKKFHNFVARGTWTAEQEDELRALIEVNGTKWSKIASIINRHPEDIRDRYRNYVVCGTAQRKDAWTEDEEARLALYVMEAMQAIDDLRSMQPDRRLLRKSYEELIDWQNISERMDRTRSRLQCITKWKSMNLKLHGNDQLASLQPDSKISFNLDRARHQIGTMPEEEQHRLLLAIRDSAAGVDAKIPWQRLVDKTFRNEWHRTTQALLWHRFKKTVPGWESRSARDCAQLVLEQLNMNGSLPDVAAGNFDDVEEMQVIQLATASSSQTKKANTEAKQATNAISDEYVMNSDAEEGGEPSAIRDDDIQIDPALTEAMAAEEPVAQLASIDPVAHAEEEFATPAKKTPGKVATYGRKKGSAKRGGSLMLSQDPIVDIQPEDFDAAAALAAAAEHTANGTGLDTASPLASKAKEDGAHVQTTNLMSSDFEEMDDLPARVTVA